MIRFIAFARTAVLALATTFALFTVFVVVAGGTTHLIAVNAGLAAVLFLIWAALADISGGTR